jgi:perosamine synthetase
MCFSISGPRVYEHQDIGFNYRMSNIHAAIGLAQLEKAEKYKRLKIRNHEFYQSFLRNIDGISMQKNEKDSLNVCWMNGILLNPRKYGRSRDELMYYLKENGIETRLFFTGMHKQKSLKDFGCDVSENYPFTENLTRNGLYLPSASSLKREQIAFIADLIRKFKK